MRLLDRLFMHVNALRNRVSKRRYAAERVLLLLPHCLQNQECGIRLKGNVLLCAGCGKCKMKQIKELAEAMGVHAFVASGGRSALNEAKRDDIDVVLAVACRRELAEGIRAAFPKKVLGVLNSWPNGECVDTDVDVDEVRAALTSLIETNGADA